MFPSHKFILFALVVFLLLLFTSYHSHQFETFISEHIIYSNVQHVPLETYSPSSLQPSKPSTNNLFETIDQQQCSCPNCGCNGQNTCPKGLPANSFVVLSAMEDCAATNQVPAIGLVNIESTSASNQFIFGIVDEDNKNKAMNNQQFDASVYKSNRSPQTCVSDSSPPFRYPAKVPGKVYLIGKSTNLVMDTNVRFNIQMSCAIPPYNRISMVAKPNELSRIYVGKRMTWSFSFINQYSNVDTWQKGTLKTSDNAYTPVTDGSSSLLYTPTTEGSFSLSLSYTPSSSIYGDAFNFNTQQIQVYKIAAGGSIEVPAKVSKREFIVKYNIKDSDGTVTPQIDKSSLSFKSEPSVDLFCINPTSDTGSGSVTCSATKTGTSVITLLYEGKTVATSLSFAVVENDSNNDDGKYWINYQTAIIAMLVLAVIVIGIVVIAGTAGIFVYCRKRRNAQRVKLSEEDQVEDLGA